MVGLARSVEVEVVDAERGDRPDVDIDVVESVLDETVRGRLNYSVRTARVDHFRK